MANETAPAAAPRPARDQRAGKRNERTERLDSEEQARQDGERTRQDGECARLAQDLAGIPRADLGRQNRGQGRPNARRGLGGGGSSSESDHGSGGRQYTSDASARRGARAPLHGPLGQDVLRPRMDRHNALQESVRGANEPDAAFTPHHWVLVQLQSSLRERALSDDPAGQVRTSRICGPQVRACPYFWTPRGGCKARGRTHAWP
jgi:hypothetical protein